MTCGCLREFATTLGNVKISKEHAAGVPAEESSMTKALNISVIPNVIDANIFSIAASGGADIKWNGNVRQVSASASGGANIHK